MIFKNGYPIQGKKYIHLQDALGQAFDVSHIMEYHRNPDVAMANDGSFIVAWKAEVSMRAARIFGQRSEANGTELGSNFQVNDNPSHYWNTGPAIAPNGSFFIVWDDYRETDLGIFRLRFGTTLKRNF